ncbi:MAG: aldo/keto reductase [Lentisphaerae bacterium]|nr:aldo/keto reductase [Lentisphaerota bacterium]
MKYTEYGTTGKQVSVVGFGGMRFDTSLPKEVNAELLHHANASGINYFDTAPGYCGDQSEDIFGEAFKDMPGQFYASTKGSPESFDTADKARDAVRRSLDRLGLTKLDFYHVWCLRRMDHYDLAVRAGGQYEGLLRCQEEGLIDHIVCSSHQPGQDVVKILSKDEFEGVLLGVNILNFPYRWDGLLAAKEKGYGVVAMNPLGGGAIPRHEGAFSFLAQPGETPTEAALRFVIGCPYIDVGLVGFATKEHIDTACKVAESATEMGSTELDALRANLTENLDQICTSCGYCRDCPKSIPIPSYMQYYNERVMFGKTDEEMRKGIQGQYRWGVLVDCDVRPEECIECGKCEEACTQHLPITQRLADLAEWGKEE